MVRSRPRYQWLAWLAIGGMSFPVHALAVGNDVAAADAAATQSWRVVDVELRSGGTLLGQVVDAGAQPVAGNDVSILSGSKSVASTRTDEDGRFAVAGLHGGVHQVYAGDTAQVCRLWAPGTAPPKSPSAVQIVTGRDVVRGQWGPPAGNQFLKNAKGWMTNPFVVGGIVAAAVAIPVAIHNANNDDDGPHS